MQKIVIKLGTSSLTHGTKNLSRRHMLDLATQMAQIHEKGIQIVIVSSGAVAAGREILPHTRLDRFALASVGQARLMQVWMELFSFFNIPVSQILLTRSDFSNRKRYLNVRDTLLALLKCRVIPIINENDAIATKEIRVGDNDNLSALVANLIAADLLILLTDQQGLYTADPRIDPKATLIPVVDKIDQKVFDLAGGSPTKLGLGTGGMLTKIEAAQLASNSGTPTRIACSTLPHVLTQINEGQPVGTLFRASCQGQESRKRWLLSKQTQGTIQIDQGAKKSLLKQGSSLLPVGILHVEPNFDRGAIVKILSQEGENLGVGISSYSSRDIKKIIGVQSKEIESLLGYTHGPEVIHRDDMTLHEDLP